MQSPFVSLDTQKHISYHKTADDSFQMLCQSCNDFTNNKQHAHSTYPFISFFTIMLYYTTGYIVCVSVFVFMVYRASFLYNTLIDYTVY